MTHRILSIATLALMGTALSSASAMAAGFYIQEQSVSGLGTSYAGQAAMPRDASILFYNPAGLTHLDRAQANIGVHMLYTNSDLKDNGTTSLGAAFSPADDGGNPGGLNEIPNLYAAMPITDDHAWWIGIGVSAPFGLGSQYNPDFFGRAASTKTELRTIDIQPTVAYQPVDWFSIGATLIMEKARGNLQRITNNGVTDLDVRLTGNDNSFGYNVGFLLEPWDGSRLGVDYRSGIKHELEGSVDTNGVSTNAYATIKVPDIASFSIAQELGDQWTLLASANWHNWSDFDNLQVTNSIGGPIAQTFFDYQTAWAFGIGFEYEANDTWTFRTGYQYDQTPTTDVTRSTLNPDGDRNWFSVGTTYTYNEDMSFDFAATYIDIEDEDISLTREVYNIQATADDTYAALLSFGLNYKF